MPWRSGEAPTPVITYYDFRGERYFYIHPSSVGNGRFTLTGRYDMRIVVHGQTTADQANVSAKQIETTARTLGIPDLTENRLELLAESTATMLRARVSR